jgi:murein DD-endopeptidase MepM/ murein hydrolase activator NlpD
VGILRRLFIALLILGMVFSTGYIILQAVMYGMLAEIMKPVPGIGPIFWLRTWEWMLGHPQPDEEEKYGSVGLTWGGAIYSGADESLPYGWPTAFSAITQGPHAGHVAIDLANVAGTPIYSTMQGTVVYSGWSDVGYGNLVVVQANTPIGTVQTYYAHLRAVDVAPGQVVNRGQPVGEMGTTGNSTGPHLHYETRLNGTLINPLLSIPASSP